jgi:hypothetical protein
VLHAHIFGTMKYVKKVFKNLFVGYQLFTNLFKLFLSNYSYLKYFCYMYIFLEL